MTESALTRCLAGLLLCLLLGGCAGASRIPEDSFYRLEQNAPVTPVAAPLLTGVLVVEAGTAAPIYRDRALLYSEPGTPARLQRYHYQYWIDTPPQLLKRGLAEYLRKAGVASQVVLPEDGVEAAFRLRIDIERFEHLRGRAGGEVAIALRLTLAERASGKLVLQEQLSQTTPVQGEAFSELTQTYQRVLTELYGRILQHLRTLD